MKPRCWCNGRAFRVDLVFILTVGLWGAALDAWSSGEVPTSAGLTVELSTTAPTFSTGVRFGVQAQFSEPVDEFTTGAIVLGGGTGEIVDLTGTGQLFRFRVIPAGESPIVISVPAGSVSDADGKANLGSNLLRVAPNASMDSFLKVYLTFDETRGTRAFDSSACGNHAMLRCRDLGSQGFGFLGATTTGTAYVKLRLYRLAEEDGATSNGVSLGEAIQNSLNATFTTKTKCLDSLERVTPRSNYSFEVDLSSGNGATAKAAAKNVFLTMYRKRY